jgi:hypothetical protein
MSPSRPTPPSPAAASGTPRPARPTPAPAAAAGRWRLPECWIPPAQILECRALLEAYHDLRREHTAWVERIHAVFFHHGAPRLGEGALRTERSLAALRAAAAAHLSPAGQLQVVTALDMLAAVEARMDTLRRQLREAARRLTGARGARGPAVWRRAADRAGDVFPAASGPIAVAVISAVVASGPSDSDRDEPSAA